MNERYLIVLDNGVALVQQQKQFKVLGAKSSAQDREFLEYIPNLWYLFIPSRSMMQMRQISLELKDNENGLFRVMRRA